VFQTKHLGGGTLRVNFNLGDDRNSKFIFFVTNYTEHGPFREFVSHSANQEVPLFYGTPKFINVFTEVPILSEINPVYNFASHLFKTHSNVILTSTSWPSVRSLSFRFFDQCFVFLASPMRATCPAHLNLLDFIT
jgi:hypothetical protein